MVDGDDYRIKSVSKTESLGLGLRLYFDYQVTKDFYINLYNQTRYYFANEKYAMTDVLTYAAYYDAVSAAYADTKISKAEYEYPVYLDFEFEPHYDLTLSKTASMGFGLPVKYSMNGETKVDGTAQDDASYSFSVNPGLSFFYTGGFPFEVTANYDYPIMGKNIEMSTSVFTVKLKLFYDFY